MNIKESNNLIAEFMGIMPEDETGWYDGLKLFNAGFPFAYGAMGNGTRDLKFRTSWDWLMPVVSKITRNEFFFEEEYREYILDIVPYGHMDDVFDAVVNFIKWYNENKIS